MSNPILVAPAALQDFMTELLVKLAVPPADAATTARCLAFANLRGFDTHGLACLPGYVECLEQGRIKARPRLTVESRLPFAHRVDADNALGQVAAQRAMDLALASAREIGIGLVTVRRSNHFGAACAYAMQALEHDCLGLVTSNASAAAAPFGALEPFLGTNPLAVAIPAGKLPPFVIDMATSEGARKKVRKALAEGREIPAGWALDREGNPTTDPKVALEGVMLPFGGMKGSAITLFLDILAGVLSGSQFAGRVLSVFSNQEREADTGHFFLALRVAAFLPPAEFKARLDEELTRLMALRPARGVDKVIYPGWREHQTERERREHGIPLDPGLVAEARALGARHGVGFPAPA